ncbi:hypothetical protein CG709_00390, partial [Lachnotalea glycerini]
MIASKPCIIALTINLKSTAASQVETEKSLYFTACQRRKGPKTTAQKKGKKKKKNELRRRKKR